MSLFHSGFTNRSIDEDAYDGDIIICNWQSDNDKK